MADDYDELQLGNLTQRRRSPEEAAKLIRDGSGKRYDPSVISLFLKIIGMGEAEVAVGPEQQVDTSKLKPRARLARNIIGQEGVVLLTKGYLLDDSLIQQLKRYEEKIGQPLDIWISSV